MHRQVDGDEGDSGGVGGAADALQCGVRQWVGGGAVTEQHRNGPRLAAHAVGLGEGLFAEAATAGLLHTGADGADVGVELLEEVAELDGVVGGEQPLPHQWVQRRKRAGHLPGVPDVHADQARADGRQDPHEQLLDHRFGGRPGGRSGGDLHVGFVQQRHRHRPGPLRVARDLS